MTYFKFRWEEPRIDEFRDWGACWAYWEVDGDGHFTRSVEAYDAGPVLCYDEAHAADQYGILPEGPLDLEELDPEYREALYRIESSEFEQVWSQSSAINRGT